jgi:hypothetical protein
MKKLGSQENPCRNNYEIDKIIRGMGNCTIYTIKTFVISDENIEQAKARKIKFVGLDEAYFIKNAINTAVAEVIKKENISLIGINKSIEVPINLDEVIKQLTERFNINVNLDEIPNKTALQLQQEYNNKVLGRWQ